MYGLSRDSLASHHSFMARQGVAVPLLSDTGTETIKALGGWGVKKLYGKESEGVVRSTVLVGPGGEVAARWTKAASKGHAAEVLAKLEALSKG